MTGRTGKVERLLLALSEKERQLRELTEQSLGFLEELAETRRRLHDRDALAERIGELERTLAEARRRLRHAGGTALDVAANGDAGPAAPALEVVFWGEAAIADATACAQAWPELRVSWVGQSASVPADARADGPVRWIPHRDAWSPVQCWNVALAATTADVVLLLGAGCRLEEAPALPAVAGEPNTALLAVAIAHQDQNWLGSDEADDLLRLQPRPAPAAETGPVTVPVPSTQAFAVRRRAFERLGPFPENLGGPAALLEYALRARDRGFAVCGLPSVRVIGGRPDEPAEWDRPADADRLHVLAAFRPDVLGRALADAPLLWELDAAAVPGFLAGVLGRLPADPGSADLHGLLQRIALGMAQHGLPAARVARMLRDRRVELLRSMAQQGLPFEGDQIRAALQAAEAEPLRPVAQELAALSAELGRDQRVRTALQQLADRMREERKHIDGERVAQAARADRADGAARAAQAEAQRREQALAELTGQLAALRGSRDEAAQHARAVEQQRDEVLQQLRTAQATADQRSQDLLALRTNLEETAAALRAAQADREAAAHLLADAEAARNKVAEQAHALRIEHEVVAQSLQSSQEERRRLEQLLEVAQTEWRRLQGELQRVTEQFERVRGERQAQQKRIAELDQRVGDLDKQRTETERWLLTARASAEAVEKALGFPGGEGLMQFIEGLRRSAGHLLTVMKAADAGTVEALLATLRSLRQERDAALDTVRDRERWVALLLREVAQRRLFARKLLDHEQAFLEQAERSP